MLESDWTQNVLPYGDGCATCRKSPSEPAGVDGGFPEPQPLVDLPRVDVAGVIDTPSPPPDFVWNGMVPRGHICLLSGHGGSGKSTLALQLAVAVAMGLPLLGVPTTPGRVIVFSGEDAEPLLRHRLATLCHALDVNPHALAERLLVLDATENPALGESVRDRETGRDFIAPTTVYKRLWEILTEHQPVLVVVDNASDVFEGNENDRSQVRGFVRSLAKICRQVGSHPAILLLTHTPKQAVNGRGESYSGSTAWHNSARARLSLTPAKDDDGRLTLSLDKLNIGPRTAEPLHLVRSHGGVLELDENAHDAEDAPNEPPTSTLLHLLADFVRRGERVSPEPKAHTNAWAMLRDEVGFPRKKYRNASALLTAMRQLERDGLISREDYRDAYRKSRTAWALTAKGWEAIGESAPSASSAPSSDESAPVTAPHVSAPSAPSHRAGGTGDRERTHEGAPGGVANGQ